jgi:hypothetical protein
MDGCGRIESTSAGSLTPLHARVVQRARTERERSPPDQRSTGRFVLISDPALLDCYPNKRSTLD